MLLLDIATGSHVMEVLPGKGKPLLYAFAISAGEHLWLRALWPARINSMGSLDRWILQPKKVYDRFAAHVQVIPDGRPSQSRPMPSTVTNVAIAVLGRYEQPAGTETRRIDNTQSDATLTRRMKIGREWSRSYQIDEEQARVFGGNLNLSLWLTHLVASAEMQLRTTYSHSEQMRESFEDELTVTVPPHSATNLVLHWKQVWEHGTVRCSGVGDGVTVDLPFRALIGLTFDQES